MLLSKDKKSRVEANNRITWFLKTTLDKSIDLPIDIFVIDIDDLSNKIDEPIGEYTVWSFYLILSSYFITKFKIILDFFFRKMI